MQSDRQHLHPFPNPPFTSFFGQNVDFQPSRICPRNFIVFDRTDNHSQAMYHPGTALGYIEDMRRNDKNAPREVESVMKEDSADIDLLMSFEEAEEDGEEEGEGYEEEEVSTARTHGNDETDTADSNSSRLPAKFRGRGRSLGLSTVSCKSRGISDKKCRELKQMVDSLRGIVPGSKRLNTVDVLDEAVKYLKSLKVELQKVKVEEAS